MRPLFMEDYISEIEICLYLARKQLRRYWAGALAGLPNFNKDLKQENHSRTQYDLDCQQILLDCLSRANMRITIYSEEISSPITIGKQGDFYLLIDPLDGTHNAVLGFPNYTTSVALYYENNYVFSWVYDISRDLVYTAALGKGAYLQSPIIVKKLITRKTNRIEDMRISFHRPKHYRDRHLIEKLIWTSNKVRVYSCSSLEICLIAAGVLDAFIDLNSPGHERSCDIAAAELILREAGGALFDGFGLPRFSLPPSMASLSDNGSLVALSSEVLLQHIV
ncbi:inositol monophosphatase family protein [Pseudomonas baetica]|uniref:inositol monophosphatase family protein n=1 Tax=Pseudomonas baetica TaxID=674054 RepID=UPI003EEA2A64